MAFRRSFRRRRSGRMRWFTPEAWRESEPGDTLPLAFVDNGNLQSQVSYVRVLRGSAPFPGVNNSDSILAGKILAERQYWRLLRLVGRMSFIVGLNNQAYEPGNSDTFFTIHWAFVRWHTNENGVPNEPLFDSSDRENQDEKPIIIAQDTWRFNLPGGANVPAGFFAPVPSPPPLYSMIDIKTRRSFRNEQDLFFSWSASAFNPEGSFASGNTFFMQRFCNLRILGVFGR